MVREHLFLLYLSIFFSVFLPGTAGKLYGWTSLFTGKEKPEKITIKCERSSHEYKKGETARFYIDATDEDGKRVNGSRINILISEDSGTRNMNVILEDRPVVVEVKQDIPGSCSVIASVVDEKGNVQEDSRERKLECGSGAIFSAEDLSQGYAEPFDFGLYWIYQKARLFFTPKESQRKKVDLRKYDDGELKKWADRVNAYDVKIRCAGPVPVTGYLAMPKKALPKSLPAVVIFNPYGVGPAEVPAGFGAESISLNVNAHGLPNDRKKTYYKDLEKGKLKDYFFIGLEDRSESYFVLMYIRALQAVKYVKDLPEWNGKDLIVAGYSQGGAQAMAAAGLDSDVTLCIVACPGLSDNGAVLKGRRSGFLMPHEKMKKNKDGDVATEEGERILKATSYIDIVNFAKRIKAEVYISAGDADILCPSASVYTAYKNIPGKKKFIFMKNTGHAALNEEGFAALYRIFRKNKKGE